MSFNLYEKGISMGQETHRARTIVPLSRRAFLQRTVAAAGMMVGAQALGGFPTIWAQNIKQVVLRQAGLNVSNMPQLEDLVKKDLGFTVKMTAIDLPVIINRGLTQPKSLDILDATYDMLPILWPSGNFQPIDAPKITHWEKVVNIYKTGKLTPEAKFGQGQNPSTVQYVAGAEGTSFVQHQTAYLTALPFLHNADTLGIRPDLIGHRIESWAELINAEFKGKAGLVAFPSIGFMDAAMALEAAEMVSYVDKGNPTRAEIDATIKALIDLKRQGHWRAFWSTFTESVTLMTSGEVVIQSMWSPAVTAVKAKGIPCRYVALKEGYRSWGLGLMLFKHLQGLKRDAAYDYLNWHYAGHSGAFFARQGYYNPVLENTKAVLSPEEWDYWYEGKAARIDIVDPFDNLQDKIGSVRDGGSYWKRLSNVAIYNTAPRENQYLTQKWNEFFTA
jgi:putative spermidine/putrescine transport system substrate-binding protein